MLTVLAWFSSLRQCALSPIYLPLCLRNSRPKLSMPATCGACSWLSWWPLPRCLGAGGHRLDAVRAAHRGRVVDRAQHLGAGRDGPVRTGRCGEWSRTWPRFSACASRAVSALSPNVDSIIFSVDVCSNGPWCTTRARGQVGHHDGRHAEAELPVVGDQPAVGRRGAVAGVVHGRRVGVVDDPRRRHVVVEAAPLVERHDEHRVVQVTGVREGVVGVGDEPLAEPDVGQRVVVGGRAVALGVERGVDEADVGQVALGHRVDERRRGDRDAQRVGVDRRRTGARTGSTSCPTGPGTAGHGRSSRRSGCPGVFGMGESWSQIVGSVESVVELWSRSVLAACW